MNTDRFEREWIETRRDENGGMFVCRCVLACAVLLLVLVSCSVMARGESAALAGDLDGDGDVDGVDYALLLEQWTGPREPLAGDLDGDGDVDGQDAALLTAAWTGPGSEDPEGPETGGGFTAIDWTGAVDLPAGASEQEALAALGGHDKVRFAAGAVYEFSLVLPRSTQLVGVHGEGDRPVFKIPAGQNGVTIANSRTDEVVLQGLEVRGPPLPHLGVNQGIRLRLNGKDGKYARRVLIEDCKVVGFDTNIEIVDDWPRVKGEAYRPGRIDLEINRCIVHLAYGSDSHHVGVYLEGLERGVVRDTVIDHSGWRPGHPEDRNKKSHNIYAQSFNGPITAEGCVFSRAAANAVQFRAGGDLIGCVISENGLGPWLSWRPGRVEGCVLLDQVDISEDEPRGHGLILTAWEMTVRRNLVARRGGSLANEPGFKGIAESTTLADNVAVAWQGAGLNFEVGGVLHGAIGSNRTIDADPGVPAFDADEIALRVDRARGVWGAEYELAGFIARCWEAVE